MMAACSKRLIPVLAFCALGPSVTWGQRAAPQQSPAQPVQSLSSVEKSLPLRAAGGSALEVEVIPAAQMAPEDKQLAASADPEIRRRSAIETIALDEPGWTVDQLVCSAFPHSLLLRYIRGNTAAERSMFSVSIARNAQQVRLLPIARKGYSLYGSAAASPAAIGAMNGMLAREDVKPPVIQIALCYAALTGMPAQSEQRGRSFVRLQSPPTISVQGSSESVSIATAGVPSQGWTLQFGPHATLLKAETFTNAATQGRKIPAPEGAPQGKPVPPEQPLEWKTIPPAKNEPEAKPVPPAREK